MIYDIVGKFPITQLNDILGGIRRNSEYYFVFNRKPVKEKSVCEDILTSLNRDIITSEASALTFYEYMWRIYSESLKGNDNTLLINGHKDRIRVRDYFKTIGLDYSKFCQEYDHDEVQEFYKDNIFKEDITHNVYESCKSIIDFDFIDDSLPERYYYASTPYNYEHYSVRVMFSANLFDRIIVKGDAEEITYEFPFAGFSGNGSVLLIRDVFIEIDKYMTDDYYRDEGLITLSKHKLGYNILDGNILNN